MNRFLENAMNAPAYPQHFQPDPVDAALAVGLKDLWFPACP